MVDRGTGIPVVLVPGIHGRWEWTENTVDALALHCRAISFSLCDEPTSGFPFDDGGGLACYVEQIREAMDRAGVERAVIIGVSYSGLAATEFAARFPERVLGLVLASALPLGWQPDARAKFYMRAPRLLSPFFLLSSPGRMLPEIAAAMPLRRRLPFLLGYAYRALRASVSPVRMARRLRWIEGFAFSDPSDIKVPTLVVTGEDHLDRVVPTAQTRQYVARIRRAQFAMLKGTGHIGIVTKPQEFADLVAKFVRDLSNDAQRISA